jgi:hypothetical protein
MFSLKSMTKLEDLKVMMNKKELMHGMMVVRTVVTSCNILNCYSHRQAPGGS